ncbi:DUF6042 family protein [Amycolatopsis sp. ATCC 39116]|uniref:DUF6042 family protein n=1 Tax=Amycolatopsis sp. (strain ATCC 39116 / 75iv2) TaxID=385957 RepID=UPI00026258FB|nr:DUF6042 family protein [Amycolatopsis sp. ATCC 39116]
MSNKRNRNIRARMARTGESFTEAARAVDGDDLMYHRRDWAHSGWARLLPSSAHILETIVATATMENVDGNLRHLFKDRAARLRFPQGVATAVSWVEDHIDDKTRALSEEAEAAFRAALAAAGRPVPGTIGELAVLLAELGVYQHSILPSGKEQWRAGPDLPAPEDVLALPASWLAREEERRWRLVTGRPALALARHLRNQGLKADLSTTILRLAQDSGLAADEVRRGLEGMAYRGWMTAHRHDAQLRHADLRELDEHARFTLRPDLEAMAAELTPEDPDDSDDTADAVIDWNASPWKVYRSAEQDHDLSSESLAVLASLPFPIEHPGGSAGMLSLRDLAEAQGMSVEATVRALYELEGVGALKWDDERRRALTAGSVPFAI